MKWKQKTIRKLKKRLFDMNHPTLFDKISAIIGTSKTGRLMYEADWVLLKGDFIFGSPIKLSDFYNERDKIISNENIEKT